MAKTMPEGATRTDTPVWAPNKLHLLRLSRNISRLRHVPEGWTADQLLDDPGIVAALDLEEMAQSIADYGQQQSILVRLTNDGAGEIVDGARRLLGTLLYNRDPGRFKPGGEPRCLKAILTTCTDKEISERNLIANMHRKDLGPIAKAYAARDAMENCDWTAAKVAAVLRCSVGKVSALVGLLTLPSATLDLVEAKKLKPSSARAFKGMPEELVLEMTKDIEGGAKPRDVLRRLKAEKRAKGKRAGRTLAEAKVELGALDCDQAYRMLQYLEGVVPLEEVRLCDFTALANADVPPGETEE